MNNSQHLAMLDSTRTFIASAQQMLIDGAWVNSASGATLDVTTRTAPAVTMANKRTVMPAGWS